MRSRLLRPISLLLIIAIVGAAAVLVVDSCRTTSIGRSGSVGIPDGAQLTYKAGDENLRPSDAQMQDLVGTISRRINSLGIAEASVQRLGEDRLLIHLPTAEGVQQVKDLISQTGQVEFIERICNDNACADFEDIETGITGADVAKAFASQDQVTGRPILSFELDRSAAQQFGILTTRLYQTNWTSHPDQLAFVLDDETLVAAVVNSPILSGNGIIQGRFTPEEVRWLAIIIETGSLPIDLTELSPAAPE